LHPFGILCGIFVSTLFGYVAAVFFYGELPDAEDRELVWKRVVAFFVATFVSGGAVLALGAVTDRVPLSHAADPIQFVAQLVAALGILALWRSRRLGLIWGMRAAAGAQVLAILLGWFHAQAPVLLRTVNGPLTLDEAAAPFRTQLWLAIGLVVALSVVVPMLVWLYRVFGAPARR
jgi:cytochrome bd-type quinol oxidase subunit 2